MLGGELGVETVRERDQAVRVGPEGKEAAGLSGGSGGDGWGSLKESDCMEGRVELWMAREIVGCGAANDATSCNSGVSCLRCDSHDGKGERRGTDRQ